jgi:hypothetical protein
LHIMPNRQQLKELLAEAMDLQQQQQQQSGAARADIDTLGAFLGRAERSSGSVCGLGSSCSGSGSRSVSLAGGRGSSGAGGGGRFNG